MDGLVDTRKKLLLNKDSLMINWVAFAVSSHLKGTYTESLEVLNSIYKISAENKLKNYEYSELYCY